MQDVSVTTQLQTIIEKLPPQGVTLSEILDLVEEGGLLILVGLLSLVFLIPVSIPGVSTIFGAAILLVGVCRLFGQNLWLPNSFRKKVVASDKLRDVFARALIWLGRLEKISKPQRMRWLAADGPIGIVNNCMLILAAILLMAPFGLIPFSNTLPALAILCLALGLLQKDGACVLLGYVANIATIVYFTVLLAGGGMAIKEAVRYFSGS